MCQPIGQIPLSVPAAEENERPRPFLEGVRGYLQPGSILARSAGQRLVVRERAGDRRLAVRVSRLVSFFFLFLPSPGRAFGEVVAPGSAGGRASAEDVAGSVAASVSGWSLWCLSASCLFLLRGGLGCGLGPAGSPGAGPAAFEAHVLSTSSLAVLVAGGLPNGCFLGFGAANRPPCVVPGGSAGADPPPAGAEGEAVTKSAGISAGQAFGQSVAGCGPKHKLHWCEFEFLHLLCGFLLPHLPLL